MKKKVNITEAINHHQVIAYILDDDLGFIINEVLIHWFICSVQTMRKLMTQ